MKYEIEKVRKALKENPEIIENVYTGFLGELGFDAIKKFGKEKIMNVVKEKIDGDMLAHGTSHNGYDPLVLFGINGTDWASGYLILFVNQNELNKCIY